jgi:CBS domain-containing protein
MDLAGLDVRAWGVDPQDPLLATPLGELPLKEPLVLAPGDRVAQAIAAMRERHVGCVFVEEDGAGLVGVFTERDFAVRVASRGRDPERARLEEVMTTGIVTLRRGDPVSWALHHMGIDGFRHIPVMDGDRLLGFLSSRSVLQLLLDS